MNSNHNSHGIFSHSRTLSDDVMATCTDLLTTATCSDLLTPEVDEEDIDVDRKMIED